MKRRSHRSNRIPRSLCCHYQDLSQGKDQEYFSDGISEELLNLLAKVPKLRVIARTSSFSYKGKDTPIAEIARVLHVAAVLEGSVRKSGQKVRITVQLIRASDSSHLWSETYDRTLDDIFKVQDEIAAAVVDKLRISLLGAVPTAKPVDPRIYPLILQANALIAQNNEAGNKQARALCEQAVALVPGEVRAWNALALVSLNQVAASERSVEEGLPQVRAAIDRALICSTPMMRRHTRSRAGSSMCTTGDFRNAAAAGHYHPGSRPSIRAIRTCSTT